jgi:hypothetical protein
MKTGGIMSAPIPPEGYALVEKREITIVYSWLWWSASRQQWEPTAVAGETYPETSVHFYCRPIIDFAELRCLIEQSEAINARMREWVEEARQ